MKAETTNGSLGTNGQAIQLLFIDDEEQVLSYVRKKLSSLGYDVVTTTGWGEAKRLLKAPDVQPDLIFIEPLLEKNNGNRSLQEICAEAAQIPAMQRDDLIDVVESALSARYGEDGSQAMFQFIQEQNPNIDDQIKRRINNNNRIAPIRPCNHSWVIVGILSDTSASAGNGKSKIVNAVILILAS